MHLSLAVLLEENVMSFLWLFAVNIQKPGVIVFGGSSLCKFLWALVTSPVSMFVSSHRIAGCLMLLQGEGETKAQFNFLIALLQLCCACITTPGIKLGSCEGSWPKPELRWAD